MSARDIQTEARSQTAASAVFKPLTVLVLFLIGLMSFGAFISLSGFEGDLEQKDYTAKPHALSKSPNGFAGLVRLLRAEDVEVREHRDTETLMTQTPGLFVITLPTSYSASDLDDFDTSGPTLVVLPKWRTRQSRTERGQTEKLGLYNADAMARYLKDSFGEVTVTQGEERRAETLRAAGRSEAGISLPTPSLEIDRIQTLKGENIAPIVTRSGSAGEDIVLGRYEETDIYILADPDLLNNSGMKAYDGAAYGVDMVRYITDGPLPVYFDLTLHGLGTNQNLVKTMLTPPFLAATLCLLMTGLMLAWRAFTRFGRPAQSARVYAAGKQALADNSADLIRLAQREPNMAPGYAALIRKLTASGLGTPKTLSESQTVESLDRMAERAKIDGKLSDMTHKSKYVTDIAGLLALANKLDKWRQEMTHDRK